jgi:hypothetical protein
MALWLRRRPGNLESAAAKTSPSAAKTPQNFRIPRHSCRENGDSLENVLPCVLGLWRKKAQRSAIRVPRSGASLFYSTHGKYFASEGCLRSPSRSRMASVSSSTARFILSSSFGMGRRVRVSDAGLCAMGEIGHREPRPSAMWVSTTSIRHPAPKSSRNSGTVLPFANRTRDPENNMPAGTSTSRAFASDALICLSPVMTTTATIQHAL